MIFKRLNRTSPEQVFAVFRANAAGIAADDVVALDSSASSDGVLILQPAAGTVHATVGIADAAIANGAYGLVQIYGYRSTSRVNSSGTSMAIGFPLRPVAAVDYLEAGAATAAWQVTSAQGLASFVLLESLVSTEGATAVTYSRKIFIRCM
jgi:hypothetical protein